MSIITSVVCFKNVKLRVALETQNTPQLMPRIKVVSLTWLRCRDLGCSHLFLFPAKSVKQYFHRLWSCLSTWGAFVRNCLAKHQTFIPDKDCFIPIFNLSEFSDALLWDSSQLLWYQSMRGNGPLGQPGTFMFGQTLWLQIWCLNTMPRLFSSRRTDAMNDSQQFEICKFPQTIGQFIGLNALRREEVDETGWHGGGCAPNQSGGNSKYRGWLMVKSRSSGSAKVRHYFQISSQT